MHKYAGQWVGLNFGSNFGPIILDLDETESGLSGHFFLFEDDDSSAGTFGHITFPNFILPNQLIVQVRPFDGTIGKELDHEQFGERFPSFDFPRESRVAFIPSTERTDEVQIRWVSDIGSNGHATLRKGNAREASAVTAHSGVRNWAAFKQFVSQLGPEEHVFRGQSQPWPLRTSFHRSKRSDLVPFIQRDIPQLYHQLSGRLRHLYNLNDPMLNASFWALAQHHGYPTPLLDWTYSPYVAAYFAYKDAARVSIDSSVRIFLFDKLAWQRKHFPMHITHSKPLVAIIEPVSLENERSIPQQSLMMMSNIDDIEWFVGQHGLQDRVDYLQAFDLPASERSTVLRELRLMGIGASSLFPGVDGVCQGMRERNFPV